MKIDQEKFNAVKALSEIQINISEGLANLKTLKETTEEYVVFREKEAQERVLKVLKESHDALEHITKNHDQLTHYGAELKAFANQIKNSVQMITTLFQGFRTSMEKADNDMKEHYLAIKEVENSIKIENSLIKTQREQLKRETKKLEEDTRLLVDRRETLERGFEELKRLKNKKI